MFGWLATFGALSRTHSLPTTRWLSLTPRTLIEGLGQLGGVLYLSPSSLLPADDTPPASGCLAESAFLAPLLSTGYVGLTCIVTAEGPREWIDCVNQAGATLARVYLLPDTDYLAWDGLFVDAVTVDMPPGTPPGRAWLRACQARVVSFSRRRLAGFDVLGASDARVSSLGRGVARDIAVAESVTMTGP